MGEKEKWLAKDGLSASFLHCADPDMCAFVRVICNWERTTCCGAWHFALYSKVSLQPDFGDALLLLLSASQFPKGERKGPTKAYSDLVGTLRLKRDMKSRNMLPLGEGERERESHAHSLLPGFLQEGCGKRDAPIPPLAIT